MRSMTYRVRSESAKAADEDFVRVLAQLDRTVARKKCPLPKPFNR